MRNGPDSGVISGDPVVDRKKGQQENQEKNKDNDLLRRDFWKSFADSGLFGNF